MPRDTTRAAPDTGPRRAGQKSRRFSPADMERWRREEPALVSAWQADGSEQALSILIKRYTPMINRLVSRTLTHSGLGLSHAADLEQEATLAFVKAVNAFDQERSSRLTPIATTYVQNALRRYTLDNRTAFRIGTNSDERKAYYAALRLRSERLQNGQSPAFGPEDPAYLSRITGARLCACDQAITAVGARTTDIADHADIAEEGDGGASSLAMSRAKAMTHLAPSVGDMTPQEAAIYRELLADHPFRRTELAHQLGLSPRAVGRMRDRILNRLRSQLVEAGITADALFE